jgi:hypothetical protein
MEFGCVVLLTRQATWHWHQPLTATKKWRRTMHEAVAIVFALPVAT